MRGLTGKVAIVVGAGSGIGRATAQRLAEEGASVAVVDIDGTAADTTVTALESSYFTTTRSALPHLVSRGGGKIVNVCSITAHVGAQLPAYTAAKGAVLAWSREIAVEFAHHGITVNTVSPGVIETAINAEVLGSDAVRSTMLDAIPVERLGKPEDVAATIAFLASSDADFVSGADIVVDGAMIASASWGTARTAWRRYDRALRPHPRVTNDVDI